jgi:aminoglycoside phosphotransferase (APT) family kinase protein
MDAKPLERLAGLKVHWRVGDPGSDFDPIVPLAHAKDLLKSHPTARVVHGDLHTGNALMLDTRTPDLIDFALAGSGHPCFDLVRVSSAIAYEFLRQLQDEAQVRSFFKRLYVDGAEESELKEEFAGLVTGVGSEVAVHALVTCRAAALEVIGSDEEKALSQYLAMVYLIAAQSLTIEEFQEGLVRCVLAAVGPRLQPIPS